MMTMMKPALSVLLVLSLLVDTSHGADDYKGLCGDCWCISDDGSGECPALGNDFRYYIPEDWSVLETFQSTTDPIKLQAPDGGPCAPLKESVGDDMPDFAEGQLPQCVLSPPQTGNFCGYKFASMDGTQNCRGREYEMVSYDTLEDLNGDGAYLMHRGACGVCSRAEDIWTKLNTLDSIAQRTVFCAITYITSQDFQGMVDCMAEIGYSPECAFMWAHYSIANSQLCAGVCLPNPANEIVGNGSPPKCEYTDCILCAEEQYPLNELGYKFVGYSGIDLGVVDRTPAHNCSSYQPVQYDLCVGAKPDTGGSGNLENTVDDPSAAVMTVASVSYVIAAVLVLSFGML